MGSGIVAPPAAATHWANVTPIGTRSVTGSPTAPAIVRNFSVTGRLADADTLTAVSTFITTAFTASGIPPGGMIRFSVS